MNVIVIQGEEVIEKDYIMNAALRARVLAMLTLSRLVHMFFLFRRYPCLIASVRPVS